MPMEKEAMVSPPRLPRRVDWIAIDIKTSCGSWGSILATGGKHPPACFGCTILTPPELVGGLVAIFYFPIYWE